MIGDDRQGAIICIDGVRNIGRNRVCLCPDDDIALDRSTLVAVPYSNCIVPCRGKPQIREVKAILRDDYIRIATIDRPCLVIRRPLSVASLMRVSDVISDRFIRAPDQSRAAAMEAAKKVDMSTETIGEFIVRHMAGISLEEHDFDFAISI